MDMAMAGGMEDAENFGKMDMLAEKHLAQGGVIGDADYIAGDLDGEMEIANEPAEARGLMPVQRKRNFQDRLGLLLDHVASLVVFEEDLAIVERMLQVEAELRAINGHPTPTALGQRTARNRQRNPRPSLGPMVKMMMDELHLDQKRK